MFFIQNHSFESIAFKYFYEIKYKHGFKEDSQLNTNTA